MTTNVIKLLKLNNDNDNVMKTVFARNSAPLKFDPNMGYNKVNLPKEVYPRSSYADYCVPNNIPLLV